MMIKVLLLDVYNEQIREVEIEPNDLDKMYELLDCRCIDIVTRKIGGKWFDIVCDDEGLFHEPQKISAVDKNGQPMLCGNLIFAHHDAGGNLTGLEPDDHFTLGANTILAFTENRPSGYMMIANCEY